MPSTQTSKHSRRATNTHTHTHSRDVYIYVQKTMLCTSTPTSKHSLGNNCVLGLQDLENKFTTNRFPCSKHLSQPHTAQHRLSMTITRLYANVYSLLVDYRLGDHQITDLLTDTIISMQFISIMIEANVMEWAKRSRKFTNSTI